MTGEQLQLYETPRRIALVRGLFLGDLLLAVPAWRALRRRFPQAELTLLGLPWAAALAARLPHLIDRFVTLAGYPGLPELPYDAPATARFLEAQRAYGYDLALQMHGSGDSSNGLTAGLGARQSLGYARPGDGRLSRSLPYPDGAHEARRWLDLVAALGAADDDPRPELRLGGDDHARAAALLAELPGDGPLVALHSGAKDPRRHWPLARFAALGAALHQAYGARLLLTGTAAEAPRIAELRRLLGAPALDLAGQTDLGAFAALLARLDLLVTNDTGASHLAAAVATPSVVLFGPSRPAEYGPPAGGLHLVVDALDGAAPGADPAVALRRLPVESVLSACIAQLGRGRAAGGELGGREALCAD